MKTKMYFKWNPDEMFNREKGGYWSAYDFALDSGAIEIEVDLPEITDAQERLVESLRDKKKKVIAEATKEAEKLDEQIQQLLALPSSAAA